MRIQFFRRTFSSHAGEVRISTILRTLDPTHLKVADISGGCGSMYSIEISSGKFQGLSILKQHRLVQDLLKDEIKQMHGLQLKTSV